MRPRIVIGLGAALALWISCVAAGFAALGRYSTEAGPAQTPRDVDEFLASHRQPNRALLIMAVHPRCPCTKASMAELGDLLARSRGTCDALILQFHPENGAAKWREDTVPRELGGVQVGVLLDPGGKQAATLGAATSGHVVFIDAAGAVRFTGGITVSRGHRGRAPGQNAILEILAGGSPSRASAPAYGCALSPECSAPLKP